MIRKFAKNVKQSNTKIYILLSNYILEILQPTANKYFQWFLRYNIVSIFYILITYKIVLKNTKPRVVKRGEDNMIETRHQVPTTCDAEPGRRRPRRRCRARSSSAPSGRRPSRCSRHARSRPGDASQ